MLARIHMIVDVFWVFLAFVVAYHAKRSFIFFSVRGLSVEPNYYLVLLIAIIIALFSYSARDFEFDTVGSTQLQRMKREL